MRGKGGVFNSRTLGLYSYTYNNPVVYIDPDGREGEFVAFWGVWAAATADAVTPDPSDAAALPKAAGYGSALVGTAIGGTLVWAFSGSSDSDHATTDTATQSRNNDEPSRVFYHGTDIASAEALLAGAPLSVEAATEMKYATEKGRSPVGFYLTPDVGAAEFFAARREGGVLQYTISESAFESLTGAGAYTQPIPQGGLARSPGTEFIVPPNAFPLFDELRAAGQINVTPAPVE